MSVLSLPRCEACGAFHYPPREACPHCFAVPKGAMALGETDGAGTVLACTRLHVSLSDEFADRLPLRVVSVELEVGPMVLAFAQGELAAGASVVVRSVDVRLVASA